MCQIGSAGSGAAVVLPGASGRAREREPAELTGQQLLVRVSRQPRCAGADVDEAVAADNAAAGAVAADAVAALYRQYQLALLQVATGYVGSRAVAEDVVQDTLLGAIVGLADFDGRSSLRTWVFRILENIAKTRAKREARTVPFSSIADHAPGRSAEGPLPAGLHHYRVPWGADHDIVPEGRLLLGELSRLARHAIESLPPRERDVITLRAIEGCSPEEVCRLLGISGASQRAALHRARSKIRACLSPYLLMERT